jgi:hypothetical protein
MMRRVADGLALLALLCAPARVGAQSADALAAECAGAGGEPTMCARAAGAGRDLAVYIGYLAGPGTELSGQASTLGRRLGGAPRIAVSVRMGGANVTVPSLTLVGVPESTPFVLAPQAAVGFGLFDGFQALPTVGGLLSFDVFAAGSLLNFSSSSGFDGGTRALSVGARLGLLRESFTLPAVTVSLSRRFVGGLQLADVNGNDQGDVAIDPDFTSVRATVGKDLFAFGVLAGLTWDDFSSATTVRAITSTGVTTHTATLEGERWGGFVGLSRQVGVIMWLAGEVGWSSGYAPVSAGGGPSPEIDGILYGSLALVLKL